MLFKEWEHLLSRFILLNHVVCLLRKNHWPFPLWLFVFCLVMQPQYYYTTLLPKSQHTTHTIPHIFRRILKSISKGGSAYNEFHKWVREPLSYFCSQLCYLFKWLTLQPPVEHKKPCKHSASSYRNCNSGSSTISVFKGRLAPAGPLAPIITTLKTTWKTTFAPTSMISVNTSWLSCNLLTFSTNICVKTLKRWNIKSTVTHKYRWKPYFKGRNYA